MLKTHHIQVLNERFLSRYGVDRILLLMAEHFILQGARVTYGCSRYNEQLFTSQRPIQLPPFDGRIFEDVDKFANAEKIATDEMLLSWIEDKPDVIVVGGWPFFDLAAKAPALGVRSVFIDAGAVPHTGLPPSQQMIQQELRRIRAQTLPYISQVLPISDFIRYSQTEPDRLTSKGVRTIYLGADHLRSGVTGSESSLLDRLTTLKRSGTKILLAAGRFEPSGYKNSMAAIHIARGIRTSIPNIRLLILHPADHIAIPEDMRNSVEGIGFPTDYELLEIIRLSDLTLSPTLWEGFNLPLVESQLEGCPTLAYACGSHPEVVADPWFLCQSEVEMATKAVQILTGKAPAIPLHNLKERYAGRFTWNATLREIWHEVDHLPERLPERDGRRLVFVDVGPNLSFLLREDARGAASALSTHLLFHPLIEVVFVQWDEAKSRFVLAGDTNFGFVSNPMSSIIAGAESVCIDHVLMAASHRCCLSPVILIQQGAAPVLMQKRVDWARSIGLTVVRSFYKETATRLSSGSVKQVSKAEMGLISVDAIICNSAQSYEEMLYWIEKAELTESPRLLQITKQTFADPTRQASPEEAGAVVHIVAIEARGSSRGFDKVVDAFVALQEKSPHNAFQLTLIGSNGREAKPGPPDHLTGKILHAESSQTDLHEVYSRADVIICPSTDGSIELVGSRCLSMGLPCILHDEFLEFEDWGGCYAANMRSTRSITRSLAALAENKLLLKYLASEAQASKVRDWSDYVDGVAQVLSVL